MSSYPQLRAFLIWILYNHLNLLQIILPSKNQIRISGKLLCLTMPQSSHRRNRVAAMRTVRMGSGEKYRRSKNQLAPLIEMVVMLNINETIH